MRFHSDGPAIPDLLLERCDAGRVVFLCGAGVSFPSGMPTFVDLTKHVIKFFNPPGDSEIMKAFRPWRRNTRQTGANVPLDQIFNLLHLEYGKDEVNALVTDRLSRKRRKKDFARAHSLIKRISSSPDGVPQIVTTNFDLLFELGPDQARPAVHVPPAFPDLRFGSEIAGITYLHGRLVDPGATTHSYVLSSADFGRAYLSEGWATNFIRQLLERYTVVLVGYQAEDPPVKYLLQGLNHDGKYDRSNLYAFDRGHPEEIEAKWRDRGVTAIAYSDHSVLWETMEAWAERADNPRRWRSSIIAKCQDDPKGMAAHERGQVAHVLRTVQGAKLFADADPLPHPEWLCAMDADVRSGIQNSVGSNEAAIFDPREAYGLDDDVRDISEDARNHGIGNENLLVWRDSDHSPCDAHRLGGARWELPKRLSHLTTWMGNSIDSPVLAWWAARQRNLHPLMFQRFEREIKHAKSLDARARHIWNLILEYHRIPRNGHRLGEWHGLQRRIAAEGWTGSVIRDFSSAMRPQLEIALPPGIRRIRPPSRSWGGIRLFDIGLFSVSMLEQRGQELIVPDEQLGQVFAVLETHLLTVSGMLVDVEPAVFEIPTCYPGRETDGNPRSAKFTWILTWFRRLFDRIDAQWPALAHAHATTWPAGDRFIFRKLKLYAFSKRQSFAAEQVAREVCAFSQESFWDNKVARELLFLLVDRWDEFSPESRNHFTDRILAGPDRPPNFSDDEFLKIRTVSAAKYARYLELRGCQLPVDRSEGLAELIGSIPNWSEDWANSLLTERGARSGYFGTDENHDFLKDVPVNEIVAKVRESQEREFGSLTEKRPFTGLVKDHPRKALAALTSAGKKCDYPTALWSSMIEEIPSDIGPRLRRVFLNRIAKLPYPVIAQLGQTLANWLKGNLVAVLDFDGALGWAVYDHIVDGLLHNGKSATKSDLEEVDQPDNTFLRSRRTLDHARAGNIGDCVAALFSVMPDHALEGRSAVTNDIKPRVDRLLTSEGEASDHAVSVASNRLSWLMSVDPKWTLDRFIPMLEFDHPASEPAWNGLLSGEEPPGPLLAATIKPLLLRVFPWIEHLSWSGELSNVAARWLGNGRLFQKVGAGGLSKGEMRFALRRMSDETRNGFIGWLSSVGADNESSWSKHVIPLINDDWPREHRYRTAASVRAWLSLLEAAGNYFEDVYVAVKRFLVPVETNDQMLYQFIQDIDEDKSLTRLFPVATLDLLNEITPLVLTRTPYELAKVLPLIADAKPDLMSDPRYLRLIELVELS